MQEEECPEQEQEQEDGHVPVHVRGDVLGVQHPVALPICCCALAVSHFLSFETRGWFCN